MFVRTGVKNIKQVKPGVVLGMTNDKEGKGTREKSGGERTWLQTLTNNFRKPRIERKEILGKLGGVTLE